MERKRFMQIIQFSDIDHSIHRFIQNAKISVSPEQFDMIRSFALAMQDYLESDIKPVWLDMDRGVTVCNEYYEKVCNNE